MDQAGKHCLDAAPVFCIARRNADKLALALGLVRDDWQQRPMIAIGGALAGLVQAIGLLRWGFAVPPLRRGSPAR